MSPGFAECDNLGAFNQIDIACDSFEREWLDRQQPEIDEYLRLAPEGHRRVLFGELLRLDLEYREKYGEVPNCQELMERFSSFADMVRDTFGEAFPSTHLSKSHVTLGKESIHSVPTLLGKYEVLNSVGTGAFGTVYRGRDSELDRIVALKVPHPHWLVNGDFVERLTREARAAARLNHPGIVRVHEVGQCGALYFLVAEFVDGSTLSDELSGRWSFDFRRIAESRRT